MQHTAFAALAAEVLDEYLDRHPETASQLGDHRFDDRLDDLSEPALDEEARWVTRGSPTCARAARRAGPGRPGRRADPRQRPRARATSSSELREHEWDPLVANPGTAVYTLLARDFAPLGDRLRSVAGRLAAVPGAPRHRARDARRHAAGARRDRDRAVHRHPHAARDRARARARRRAGPARRGRAAARARRRRRSTSTSTGCAPGSTRRDARPAARRRSVLPASWP